MLPPPPASRQASYAYTMSRQPSSRSTRHGSGRWSFREGRGRISSDAEADADRDEREAEEMEDEEEEERERGLEQTLEQIGFGPYQWRLLALCGFGWMSDNSALQCVAVILPRVQIHFDLEPKTAGLLSSATMLGMMVGAVAWGTASDMLGRAMPFNFTLFLTAVFGIGASFSNSFIVLLFWMFLLGSAVGGSMPTDGTLFLENLPHSKQYLLTLLSVFFSLGAVLSSVVSYFYLPGASCTQFAGCDIAGHKNDGWKRVLFVLGCCNLACAFARWFLFRLQESPRYLVSTGREQEAVVALRAIANFNAHSIDIECADVQMDGAVGDAECKDAGEAGEASPIKDENGELPLYRPTEDGETSPTNSTKYDSVGIGRPPTKKYPIRSASTFYTPSVAGSPRSPTDHTNRFEESFSRATPIQEESEGLVSRDEGEEEPRNIEEKSRRRTRGLTDRAADGWNSAVEQLSRLFVPQWRRTVILMWIIWGSMSFSYTMFNVWLPAVLESRAEGEGDAAIRYALKEFVLYSVAGCPGSIIGAWMIQTRLGRRKSLAICTMATGLSTFAFIRVQANWAVITSSMIISGAATAMYAVLYGMTPETFGTSIRGTAGGTSAAISRLTGFVAPVTAGVLLSISPSLPVFASAAVLVLVTASCSLALPFERVLEGGKRGGAVMH